MPHHYGHQYASLSRVTDESQIKGKKYKVFEYGEESESFPEGGGDKSGRI
ncbi:hypothetical protein DSLASN_06650 [Desulfoluna limicola]|uniref:Uncharacterized protein n=1 Tax=Desulfoluna limicola TaxID=2810562 RepID=A0ABN6EXE4_9BACT|nr:hypothetical protein DSLASN_06650 [Desulfoluna limicola]